MPLSRREVLTHLAKGSAGAGIAALLGGRRQLGSRILALGAAPAPETTYPSPGPPTSSPEMASSSPEMASSLPELAAVPSITSHAGTQVFRSRPDLHPPVITVDTSSDRLAAGLVLTDAHYGPANQGPMIISGSGDLVWFLDLSPGSDTGLRAFNFQVQSFKGKPVLTWFQGAVVNGHGVGHYELWDSTYTKVAEIQATNGYQADLHDFVLTDKGTALFTCYGQASANLKQFGGKEDGTYAYGVVQEVDVSTGDLLFEWRSNDHVTLQESYQKITSTTVPWDYFHVNSIDVDPTDGNFIISGRNTWTIYKVDRTSGEVLWRLGGKATEFELAADAHFAFQHDVRRYPDGSVSMFDNEGGPPNEASQSRGLLLSVDEKSRKAGLLRAYYHSPPVLSEALGSVQELSDGHTFIGWGESSYFTEYDATGKLLFDGHLTKLTESYRAFKQVWTGQPVAERPALAIVRGSTTATLYASFNGCTELTGWIVLGGPTPDRLTALGHATSLGFETAVTVHAPPAYFAVQAMSSTGQVLARSEPGPG